MKEFIEYIAKQLTDKPSDVQVIEARGERVVVYELHVGAGDAGKIIGKRGQTISAIRILLNAASAAKDGNRSVLEIID